MKEPWQKKHEGVMRDFVRFINAKGGDDFLLKGETALFLCYGLDRFSEDLDFDGLSEIMPLGMEFCKSHHFGFNNKKDTSTTQRFTIHYDDAEEQRPLKVECSYRKKNFDNNDRAIINGIRTYSLDNLFSQKIGAYMGRDKLRDIYDVMFILNSYFDRLSGVSKRMAVDALSEKGLDHFDFVVATEQDDLIDTDKLAEAFLDAFDKLGLLPVRDEDLNVENDDANKNPGLTL